MFIRSVQPHSSLAGVLEPQEPHTFSLPMGTAGMRHELREENIDLRNQVKNLQQDINQQNNELQSEMQTLREEDNKKKIEVSQL